MNSGTARATMSDHGGIPVDAHTLSASLPANLIMINVTPLLLNYQHLPIIPTQQDPCHLVKPSKGLTLLVARQSNLGKFPRMLGETSTWERALDSE